MTFSIITPSYKQLDWLRLCAASVRDQVTFGSGGIGNVECGMRNEEHAPSSPDCGRLDEDSESKIQNPEFSPPSAHSEFPIPDFTLFNRRFTVEHIIQDAGSPGIEEFAREAGADFYRDGQLIFRGKSADAELSGFPEDPKSCFQNSTQAPSFHEIPADSVYPVKKPSQSISNSSFRIPHYSLTIHCERDHGMYDAINRGLARSTGEICAWVNSDEQYLTGT